MTDVMFRTSTIGLQRPNKQEENQQLIDLNIFTVQSNSQEVNARIQKLHNQMFIDQNKEVVVGYLTTILQSNSLFKDLSYSFQQIEYKKINNPEREQILVVFSYTGAKIQNTTEPITLVTGAKNEYSNERIDMQESQQQIVKSSLDTLTVLKQYKEKSQSEADPFRTLEKASDEEINRLYYICLRECQARSIKCILLYVNKVNEKILTDARIVTRIFQTLTKWQDIGKIEEKKDKKEN